MLAPRYRVHGPAFSRLSAMQSELTAFRRDLHAHPELGFEEVYTAGRVAAALRAVGVDEVHTGIGQQALNQCQCRGVVADPSECNGIVDPCPFEPGIEHQGPLKVVERFGIPALGVEHKPQLSQKFGIGLALGNLVQEGIEARIARAADRR